MQLLVEETSKYYQQYTITTLSYIQPNTDTDHWKQISLSAHIKVNVWLFQDFKQTMVYPLQGKWSEENLHNDERQFSYTMTAVWDKVVKM